MIKYFVEIKNRIIIIFVSYFCLFLTIYYYSYFLLILTVFLNKEIINNNVLNYFIFTSISDLFFTYLKLTNNFSIFLVYFNVFYHFICFLKPGLYKKEFFYLKFYFKLNLIFNFLFFIFFNNILLSFISNFFFNVHYDKNNFIKLFFEANICEYFMFYKKTYISFFINFQFMALFLLFLSYLNISILKKSRKIIYFTILIFSTVVTPPDVFNLFLGYFILIILFEINLFFMVTKKKLNQVNN